MRTLQSNLFIIIHTIHSKLKYVASIRDPQIKSSIFILKAVQNRAGRFILYNYDRTSSVTLLKNTLLLTTLSLHRKIYLYPFFNVYNLYPVLKNSVLIPPTYVPLRTDHPKWALHFVTLPLALIRSLQLHHPSGITCQQMCHSPAVSSTLKKSQVYTFLAHDLCAFRLLVPHECSLLVSCCLFTCFLFPSSPSVAMQMHNCCAFVIFGTVNHMSCCNM